MNNQEKKNKFLEMRIKGETFQSISENLDVSKQTLINWSKESEIAENIKVANTIKLQTLINLYNLNHEERLKYHLELHCKLKLEIEKRDLSDISTEKLIKTINYIEEKINKLTPAQTFGGEDILPWILTKPAFIFDPKD